MSISAPSRQKRGLDGIQIANPTVVQHARVPRTLDYTVAYESDGTVVDLCKIIFGGDGSYYLTAPYHPQNRAVAAKITVNYAKQPEGEINYDEAVELAVLDDDERRLKIAHHPDGLIQFSGQGIRSGLDPTTGLPRGIGVHSWPLRRPTLGPSFGLSFSDPIACGRPSLGRPRTVVTHESDLEHMRGPSYYGLHITGYYGPPRWREFVFRETDGSWWMNLFHPNAQASLRLRVVLASKESALPGFVGLQVTPHGFENVTEPTFYAGTSTGNLRRNEDGDLLGDQLVCAFPRPDLKGARLPSLNYALPAPPYTASPGTTEIDPESVDPPDVS